jgi:hypothetical protein
VVESDKEFAIEGKMKMKMYCAGGAFQTISQLQWEVAESDKQFAIEGKMRMKMNHV